MKDPVTSANRAGLGVPKVIDSIASAKSKSKTQHIQNAETPNFQPADVELVIPFPIPFGDEKGKSFWKNVADAISRGETVGAAIKSVGMGIDSNTLSKAGVDNKGNPLFGVGEETKLAVRIEIVVRLNVPTI